MSISKWKELILNCDDAYFFNSPEWVKILEKTYDFQNATRLFEVNGKEILVPMVKNKRYGLNAYNSIPCGYGGFISNDLITSDEIKIIIDKIIGGKNIVFDFAIPPLSKLSLNFNDSSINAIKDSWDYTHILFLEKNFDEIFNRFKKKNRQLIRKAEVNNVEIRKGDSLEDFKDYYYLYSKGIKRWGYETPPHPWDLYKNMYKYGSDHVNLDLAIKDDKTIAGAITFNYGNNVFGFSDVFLEEYGALNPVRLLLWHSIKCACNNGYKVYNLGSSGNLSGVKKFKQGFGSKIIETKKFRAYSNLGKLIFKLFRK